MSCFGSSRAHGDHQEHLDRAVHLLQVCLDGLQHICQIPGASPLLNTVLSLVKKVQFSGQITVEALVDDTVHKITVIQREVVLAREAIIAEIRLPHVSSSFQANSQVAKSRYLDGTFTRVLEELEAWAKGDSGSTFERLRKPIWILSESQGWGKSTLASELCRRLCQGETYPALGASFFFNLAMDDLSTARDFFPTLAYQLAQSQPVLRPLIVTAAREYLSSGKSQQLEFAANTLLLEPLRALARSQQQQPAHTIVIVVDGVDECADHAADTLPKMLGFLVACAQVPSSPIRILLTTRPTSIVDSVLDSSELRGIVHRHHLHGGAKATTSDITTYLHAKLHGLETIQRSPTLMKKLASHVGPSFAYAQALADFVLEHPEHLTIALSLGSAQPSPSLCALYSAITAHCSRLDSHQWKRMRGRVDRPSILDLCGASPCYQGVTSWLRSQWAHSLAPSTQSLPDGLCMQCRTTVESAPFEAWILKRIVSCLLSSGLDAAAVLPSIPLDGHTREDPWHPEQSVTSHSRTTSALPEPLVDCEEAIQLPCPQVPVKEPAAGPAITEPLENTKIKRIPSARTVQPEESTGRAPLHEAATVRMPIAQPLEEPFVGGFVAQIQASMAAISPPPVVVPQPAPLLPDVLPLHKDTTPIPTPTAPTASRPRPPKLRIAISDPPPHTTSPIPLPYPLGVHAHETPVERRVHSPTAFRSVAPSTPRSSPRRCSPRARRGSVVLQRLGIPIQQRVASPWDIRRTPNRVVAGSPVRARTGARRDLWQTDSLPSRRDSPCSPLVATSPDMRRNTA
ncbi:hypothetical protein TRAPUB_5000 [Trametes pubescens]|uniref:Nephrocystin 3-like N-terminal domain-containing protein n=1 Tax=Trametes pubescens TaxID=154538 RepID=A0A1M2V9N0_TRAPU|nr:hypothetical protein TRAPUB_5000 [Trametes pubescens]